MLFNCKIDQFKPKSTVFAKYGNDENIIFSLFPFYKEHGLYQMEASTTAFSITAGAVEAGGSWPPPIEREV